MRKFELMLMTVLLLLISSAVWSQSRTIKGTVADVNGLPVSNASVVVKGSSVGTVTGEDGAFTLNVGPSGETLVISSVGMVVAEVKITSSNNYNIVLQSKDDQEAEVVVTGLRNVRRAEFPGAASIVTRSSLVNRPVGSLDQLLQGQVPGLLATTTSGQPGSPTNIIIRGTGSISGGTNPLYVIDGIPVEATVFQALNPNDIESMVVNKDAATSALYGSRGSAGVIVITTRRGSTGKLNVTYNGQFGVKNRPDFAFRPMNTTELLDAQATYGSITQDNNNSNIPGWYYNKSNPRYQGLSAANQAIADQRLDSISRINTDWKDFIFRNGPFNRHQLSLSGGQGSTRFYSSLEYYDEQGTTPRTDMNRISMRNNLDYTGDRFTFKFSSSLGFVRRNFQQSTTTNGLANPFLAVNVASPTAAVFKPDGTYATGTGSIFTGANQLDATKYDENYNNQIKAILGITAEYKITPVIFAGVTTGIDFRETQASNYGSKLAFIRVSSTSITGKAGFQTESLNRYLQSNIRPSISYRDEINGMHKIDVGVYGEYLSQLFKNFGATGFGIDPRTPNTIAAVTQGNATNQLFAQLTGGKSQNALASGMVMGNYTFDDRYTFTGSYRYDGSSKLPKNNRWVPFYSLGGVWNAKNEKFLSDKDFINSLRLRVSFGTSGNSDNFPFSDFFYIPTYAVGDYQGMQTLGVSSLGNSNLTWETTQQLNAGIDFSFFKTRLTGSFDVYDKRTKDLFVSRTLPFEQGGASVQVNAGELQNKGVEVDLAYDVIRGKDFRWNVRTNFAYNRNEILSLGGLNNYTLGTSLITVGQPLGTHYEVEWAGIDASNGQPLYYKLDGTVTNQYSATDKVQKFGTWESPYKGGVGTNASYKNLNLSVLFSWQAGGTKTDNLEYFVENPINFLGVGYNQSSDLNMWTKPGDIATTPSPRYATNFSSKIIHSTDFMRLRDLVLSYNLPTSLLSKTKVFSSIRLYAQGTNLFIWTKWRGMDPEAGVLNINLSEYPNARAYTFGIDVSF
jgi:TonB-linked SusC/RagA family outer membrane protein